MIGECFNLIHFRLIKIFWQYTRAPANNVPSERELCLALVFCLRCRFSAYETICINNGVKPKDFPKPPKKTTVISQPDIFKFFTKGNDLLWRRLSLSKHWRLIPLPRTKSLICWRLDSFLPATVYAQSLVLLTLSQPWLKYWKEYRRIRDFLFPIHLVNNGKRNRFVFSRRQLRSHTHIPRKAMRNDLPEGNTMKSEWFLQNHFIRGWRVIICDLSSFALLLVKKEAGICHPRQWVAELDDYNGAANNESWVLSCPIIKIYFAIIHEFRWRAHISLSWRRVPMGVIKLFLIRLAKFRLLFSFSGFLFVG